MTSIAKWGGELLTPTYIHTSNHRFVPGIRTLKPKKFKYCINYEKKLL